MHWRDELADAIQRWNRQDSGYITYYRVPSCCPGTHYDYSVRTNYIKIAVGSITDEKISHITGCINEDTIGEGKPGTIMISSAQIRLDKDGVPNASLVFAYRERSWNEFLTPHRKWEIWRDSEGNLAYPAIRFSDIP